jgi:hypothetical protein
MPRRIAHQEHTHTFGVLTAKYQIDDNFDEVEVNYIKIFDDQTFEGEKYNFKTVKFSFDIKKKREDFLVVVFVVIESEQI